MVACPRILVARVLFCLSILNFWSKHLMAPDAAPAWESIVNVLAKNTSLTIWVSIIALTSNLWLKQAELAWQNKLMEHTMKLAMAS